MARSAMKFKIDLARSAAKFKKTRRVHTRSTTQHRLMRRQIRAEILSVNFKLKYESYVFILSRIALTRLSALHSDML